MGRKIRGTRRAFTVIDLLAAILLPTLSRARERAQRTIGLSNLRNMYVSSEMRADDADDDIAEGWQ